MKIKTIFVGIVLFFGSLYSAESIGKVIAVEGKALANERILSRGADVFISDMIKIAEKSKIQIRFTDGGILNLIELTEYRIDSYQFNKTGTDGYSAELAKGGFRMLTGEIHKSNPEGVSVKTPILTIGIRGTLFKANIVQGIISIGVETGSVVLQNGGGVAILKPGEYLSTNSWNTMGTPTTVQPDALNATIFTAPVGGQRLETAREPTGFGGGIRLEINQSQGNPPCQ